MKTLYISDLDGTLLNKEGCISDYTIETINKLIDKNIYRYKCYEVEFIPIVI